MGQHLAVVFEEEEVFQFCSWVSFVTHFFIKETELFGFYSKLIMINDWVSKYLCNL